MYYLCDLVYKYYIMSLKQTIAISGVGRGIGRAIAEAFGEVGWTVFGAARSTADLENLQQHWQAQPFTGELHLFSTDLSEQKGCLAWAAVIKKNTNRLDALVNNVGQFAPGTLLDGPDTQLASFLKANVLSAHYLSKALLPLLEVGEKAHLLTIGSVATTDWPAPMANYALSKYALEGWHRTMSRELAETSISCTLLRPGATYTSSWDGVEVDPTTLLAPAQIAQLVLRRLTEDAALEIEEITIRP
jgi:short-subunit dehydrogenase